MNDDPFEIKIIPQKNNELDSRKSAMDLQTAQNQVATQSVALGSSRNLASVLKFNKTTMELIILLVIVMVGIGTVILAKSVENDGQNQELDKTLQQMQKQAK